MGGDCLNYIVAPMVEGYGDVPAVRVLLNRMAHQLAVANPVRHGRGQLAQREGLRRAAAIAVANIAERGAILLLIDADDDCAATKALELANWLKADFGHVFSRVVFVVKEFEAWIVGGDAIYGVDDPDRAGNLEGRIREVHGKYKKSVDQPKYIFRADLDRLRTVSRSFRRFDKVVREIIADAESSPAAVHLEF